MSRQMVARLDLNVAVDVREGFCGEFSSSADWNVVLM